MPALLMSTSILPNRCSALLIRFRAVETSPTSPSTSSRSSDGVSVPAVVTRREFATTLKPAARNPLVKPSPMPLEAPVISAVCLWLLFMVTQMGAAGMRFAIPPPACRIGLPFGKAFDGQETQRAKYRHPLPNVLSVNACVCSAAAWTAHVIWYLREGERCFTELQTRHRGSLGEDAHRTVFASWSARAIVERFDQADIAADRLVCPYTRGAGALRALANVVDIAQRLKCAQVAG